MEGKRRVRIRLEGRPSILRDLSEQDFEEIQQNMIFRLRDVVTPGEEDKDFLQLTNTLRKAGIDVPDSVVRQDAEAYIQLLYSLESKVSAPSWSWLYQIAQTMEESFHKAYKGSVENTNKYLINMTSMYLSTREDTRFFLHGMDWDEKNRAEPLANPDLWYLHPTEAPHYYRTFEEMRIVMLDCIYQTCEKNYPGAATVMESFTYPRAIFDAATYILKNGKDIFGHASSWAATWKDNVLHFIIIEPNGPTYFEYNWELTKPITQILELSAVNEDCEVLDKEKEIISYYKTIISAFGDIIYDDLGLSAFPTLKVHMFNDVNTNNRFGWCTGMSMANVMQWKRKWKNNANVEAKSEWGTTRYGFNESVKTIAEGFTDYVLFHYLRDKEREKRRVIPRESFEFESRVDQNVTIRKRGKPPAPTPTTPSRPKRSTSKG